MTRLMRDEIALLILGVSSFLACVPHSHVNGQPTARHSPSSNSVHAKGELPADLRQVYTVVVTGVGEDPESATMNARQQALDQVVGTLVDAETIVKNSQLVRDKIAVHQRGDVQGEELLSTKEIDGLVHVRMKINVVSANLVQRLNRAGIAMRDVAGERLYLGVKFRQQNIKSAARMLANAMEEYTPEQLYETEVVGKPVAGNAVNGQVPVQLSVTIRGNMESWRTLRENLSDLLSRTAKARIINDSIDTEYEETGFYRLGQASRGNRMYYQIQHDPTKPEDPRAIVWANWIFLNQSFRSQSEPGKMRSQWECYWIDDDTNTLFKEMFAKKLQLRVRLVTGGGDIAGETLIPITLRTSNVPVTPLHFREDSNWRANFYLLGPFLWGTSSAVYYAPNPPPYEVTVAVDNSKSGRLSSLRPVVEIVSVAD